MAAGCPVVAYRAGGSLDTVKENISGVFSISKLSRISKKLSKISKVAISRKIV